MNIWRQVKTVLWSFIGIGGRGPGPDNKVNLLVVVAIAFALVALLLGALIFIVKNVVVTG